MRRMRLRNIPRADETVAASPFVIERPEALRGSWQQVSGGRPIRIEVGMGKGRFLTDMAAQHPECFFVGVERYTSVLLRAVEKAQAGALDMPEMSAESANFRFLCEDAARLTEVFAPGEVERIYLNFSDPWPKKRHADRRLTSPRFLELYGKLLAAGDILEFKTDNQELFSFSLESAAACGWEIVGQTRDLHRDVLGEGNVMTEYEEKFSSLGNPICKMILRRPATE